MFSVVTWAVIASCVALLVLAGLYARADRLIDDRILAVVGLVEVGLVVQVIRGLLGLGQITDGGERATFVAYLLSLPLIPVGTAFLALKEKSRWAMGSLAIGAFAVAVMCARLQQIWSANA